MLQKHSINDTAPLKNSYYDEIIKNLEPESKKKQKLRKRDLTLFYNYAVQLNVLMKHTQYCEESRGNGMAINSVMCENKLRELQQQTLLAGATIKIRYRRFLTPK